MFHSSFTFLLGEDNGARVPMIGLDSERVVQSGETA